MLSTFPILICCLYALSAVEATPFSMSGSVEVQQGNAKAAIPLSFWSDNKSDDDDKDDKWSKDDDDCASRSVSVLIGTSTYAIPCFLGGNIVNLNGLLPTSTPTSSIASSSATEASSSAVSSSTIDSSSASSSSEASSATDITTTTDSITTTTGTTTSADSVPTFAVTLYTSSDCMGAPITTTYNSGCFEYFFPPLRLSVGTSSDVALTVRFFEVIECTGIPVAEAQLGPSNCSQYLDFGALQPTSYSVMFTV